MPFLFIYPLLTSTTLHHCTLSLLRYMTGKVYTNMFSFSVLHITTKTERHCDNTVNIYSLPLLPYPFPPHNFALSFLPLPSSPPTLLSPFPLPPLLCMMINSIVNIPLELSSCFWEAGPSQACLPGSHLLHSKEEKNCTHRKFPTIWYSSHHQSTDEIRSKSLVYMQSCLTQ